MKVFAELIEENSVSYRRKTLLQFGESTNLIGSIVLMNPGSANPNDRMFNMNIINEFYQKNHDINFNVNSLWRSFDCDATMKQIEKIFNGGYLNKHIELNGIIQLFNCFYFKDPNLENARNQFSPISKYLFNEFDLFINKPVYFGWGNEGKDGVFKDIAIKIFSEYNHQYTPIYNLNFEKNSFYYPKTINIHSKTDNKIKILLEDFYKLIKLNDIIFS